jgi:hypothetical protein
MPTTATEKRAASAPPRRTFASDARSCAPRAMRNTVPSLPRGGATRALWLTLLEAVTDSVTSPAFPATRGARRGGTTRADARVMRLPCVAVSASLLVLSVRALAQTSVEVPAGLAR